MSKTDKLDENKIQALLDCIEEGNQDVLIEYLNENGNPDLCDDDGFPLITLATFCENKEAVKMLIDKGANVDFPGKINGTTALMGASEQGSFEIAGMLLKAGADANLQNGFGHSALILSSRDGKLDIVKLLLDHVSNIETVELQYGCSALNYAAGENQYDIVRLLIDKGADINSRDINENSPIIAAAKRGSKDLISLLLQHGAGVNDFNCAGFTPLIQASGVGNYEVCKLLIENGADINFESCPGLSAISAADLNEHQKIIKLLIDNGAIAPE